MFLIGQTTNLEFESVKMDVIGSQARELPPTIVGRISTQAGPTDDCLRKRLDDNESEIGVCKMISVDRSIMRAQHALELATVKLCRKEMKASGAPLIALEAAIIVGGVISEIISVDIVTFDDNGRSGQFAKILFEVDAMTLRLDCLFPSLTRCCREAGNQILNAVWKDVERRQTSSLQRDRLMQLLARDFPLLVQVSDCTFRGIGRYANRSTPLCRLSPIDEVLRNGGEKCHVSTLGGGRLHFFLRKNTRKNVPIATFSALGWAPDGRERSYYITARDDQTLCGSA
ncbi:hypothetical protein DF058_34405 [Burkholderia cenocepacia]|nr:hypothetical protein DF058_34405 [Burkholderia cenocepacia]RRA03224.1 hypothetical protein DF059_34560 [Burkholderia cenocepacia]